MRHVAGIVNYDPTRIQWHRVLRHTQTEQGRKGQGLHPPLNHRTAAACQTDIHAHAHSCLNRHLLQKEYKKLVFTYKK